MRSTGRRGPSPALAVAIALLAFTAAAFVDLEMVSFASAAGPNKLAPARGPERLARKNNTMKVNFLAPNIVDGRPVSPPFSYPWAVPILDTDYKPDINAMRCGGTIISTRPWIMLTAAHCTVVWFPRRNGPLDPFYSLIRVQAHRFNLDRTCAEEQCITLRPIRATWHPRYGRPTLDGNTWLVYDFALWLLQPVPANYTLPTINVPELDMGTAPGAVIKMLGWGWTEPDEISPTLQEKNVTLITPARCAEIDGIPMSPSFQCSLPTNGIGGQCRGDSGSPTFKMVRRTVKQPPCKPENGVARQNCGGTTTVNVPSVVGVNSFGPQDCGAAGTELLAAGQARVSFVRGWMNAVICGWGGGRCPRSKTTARKVTTTRRGRTTTRGKVTTTKKRRTTTKKVAAVKTTSKKF